MTIVAVQLRTGDVLMEADGYVCRPHPLRSEGAWTPHSHTAVASTTRYHSTVRAVQLET